MPRTIPQRKETQFEAAFAARLKACPDRGYTNRIAERLPDFAGLFADHFVAFYAAEGFGEFRHVAERSDGAILG